MTLSSPVLSLSPAANVVPARENVHQLFQQGNLVPVYRTLLADLETPVSVYLKLTKLSPVSFLLESVEGGEQVGRYSFLGVDPSSTVSVKGNQVTLTKRNSDTATTRPLNPSEDPLGPLRQQMAALRAVKLEGLPRFVGGAVGSISYDVIRYFETLPEASTDHLDVPDLSFMMVDTLVIFDHVKHRLTVLSNAHNTGDPYAAYDAAVERIDAIIDVLKQPLPEIPVADGVLNASLESNMTREKFEANVVAAKEYVAAGDAFQIVLSQRLSRQTSAPPLQIYRALRALNPSPYMFLLQFSDDFTLIGASPEMMVRLEDEIATVRPIAGTRKRGRDQAEDDALADELLNDAKERAEHVMLVDLGRNDLGRVCEYGTVRVPDMMYIERYSHVMHIVSTVEGKIRPGMDAFDLIRATFPAGTLSGAPKVRAMEIIEELEGDRRGPYGGAVGYFSYDGSMDTCITIRTILMQGKTIHVQAGAGIVADSDPAFEYEESLNKASALNVAVDRAEQGQL